MLNEMEAHARKIKKTIIIIKFEIPSDRNFRETQSILGIILIKFNILRIKDYWS
jgi:hypothetical protein